MTRAQATSKAAQWHYHHCWAVAVALKTIVVMQRAAAAAK